MDKITFNYWVKTYPAVSYQTPRFLTCDLKLIIRYYSNRYHLHPPQTHASHVENCSLVVKAKVVIRSPIKLSYFLNLFLLNRKHIHASKQDTQRLQNLRKGKGVILLT